MTSSGDAHAALEMMRERLDAVSAQIRDLLPYYPDLHVDFDIYLAVNTAYVVLVYLLDMMDAMADGLTAPLDDRP